MAIAGWLPSLLLAPFLAFFFLRDGGRVERMIAAAVPNAFFEKTLNLMHQVDRTTRAYGEMVNVLWKDGMTAAAIRLETLWNELAQSHDFNLLCGYSMGNFYKDAAVGEITRQHTHVLADTGEAATIN